MPIQPTAIFGPARTTVSRTAFLSQSIAISPLYFGRWMLDACSRFTGVGRLLAIYRSSVFWLTAWGTAPPFLNSPIFFLRVIRIALRISRVFDPRRQQHQIEKIHRIDSGRGHQFHLLEGNLKAT